MAQTLYAELEAQLNFHPDYFTTHPDSSSKKGVAEVLRVGYDVKTPTIFGSFDEARQSGPFIIRPQFDDYLGPSGLGDSVIVTPESISKAQRNLRKHPNYSEIDTRRLWVKKDSILADVTHTNQDQLEHDLSEYLLMRSDVKQYLRLTGLTVDQFVTQLGFSYWQYLPGINFAIHSDSSVRERTYVYIR